MISYAQNFEDVILRRVFRDRNDGFYIDVGAMDPVIESVTKFFYDQGWSGINIEPNGWFYNKLSQERPRDINLNLALGEREEEKEIYLFDHIGNSTFEEASRDRYVERGFEAKPKTVKVTTLAAICQEYVSRHIDFLKIDCEGWEEFVIKGADWDRSRPTVLVIEATEPGTTTPSWSEWEPYLIEQAQYDMAYFDGLNRFYLRRDAAALRSHFELPPNFHDEFTVYATEAAEQASQTLRQERDTVGAWAAELEQNVKSTAAAAHILQQERDNLARRVAELEAQAARDRDQIAQLQKKLLKTRLWVGQLSQDLAASRQR